MPSHNDHFYPEQPITQEMLTRHETNSLKQHQVPIESPQDPKSNNAPHKYLEDTITKPVLPEGNYECHKRRPILAEYTLKVKELCTRNSEEGEYKKKRERWT